MRGAAASPAKRADPADFVIMAMKYNAAYARQSLLKKDSLSIRGQLDLCRKAAGGEVKVYQDAGYSGKNTNRPDFTRLLKDIKDNKIGTLYVYRLDRFSRSVADFSRLWETLQEHEVEFVSVSENFDTTTPMGRAMLHIIMVFAQLERETISERVTDNYYRRISLGAWPGGPAPYGFRIGRAESDDGRKAPCLVATDTAEVVRRIFQGYDQEEMSLGRLAKQLNEQSIPAPRRETWDNVTLSRLLHNPAYVMADEQVRLYFLGKGVNVVSPPQAFDGVHGISLVGKRKASDRKYTDIKDHTASVMNHTGLVPADLWLRCQSKLDRNRQLGNSGKGTYTWLTGLLKCAKCGYSLKVTADGKHRWLACSGRYNVSKCDASIHVKLTELEEIASKEIVRMMAECPGEAPEVVERDVYASQLEELDRRADRLIDAFSESEDIPPAYLRRSLARLEQERQRLLEAQRREKKRVAVPVTLDFPALSFEEKKLVAAQFIRRIDVSEDGAEIIWNI